MAVLAHRHGLADAWQGSSAGAMLRSEGIERRQALCGGHSGQPCVRQWRWMGISRTPLRSTRWLPERRAKQLRSLHGSVGPGPI